MGKPRGVRQKRASGDTGHGLTASYQQPAGHGRPFGSHRFGASCSAKVLSQSEVRSTKVETWPQEALEQFLLASLIQHEQAGHHYLLTSAGPRKITLGSEEGHTCPSS